ncbi:hypothetical protein A1D29_10580 [Pasteurellaceae bacterium Orientalotternb1]|nr:hypothetical protein A1D29_10580 [Pasteurellaceae bacterium Orientalotternb1]
MVNYGSVAFDEQIEFYTRKIPTPTQSWADIYGAEHDYAAVVAGAHKREIIEDFAAAIQDFIANGKTLEEFRQRFDEIVAKHNWTYNGGRNWRTRIIYETNLRSSYQAGRYAQLNEMRETMPWWEYVHSDAVARPRPEHQSWDGLILHHSDPWWKTHFPINAWGCQCTVIGRSQAYLDRLGLKPDTAPEIEWQEKIVGVRSGNPRLVRVPKGIDPSFEHIPGAARLESQVMTPLDENGEPKRASFYPHLPTNSTPLPQIRKFGAEKLLPLEKSDDFYVSQFLAEFGATLDKPVIFTDVVGEPLVISKKLFTSRSGHSKAKKRGREKYLLLLAEALRHPDEIWVRVEHWHNIDKLLVRRRYISRIEVEGEEVPTLAVFEVGDNGWEGVTTFASDNYEYLEQVRTGVLLYRREE